MKKLFRFIKASLTEESGKPSASRLIAVPGILIILIAAIVAWFTGTNLPDSVATIISTLLIGFFTILGVTSPVKKAMDVYKENRKLKSEIIKAK